MTRIRNYRGILSAVTSALLLGLTPIFGKQAISAGMYSLAVVAVRTLGAACLLILVVVIFRRRYLYIFPLGLAGCLIAGALNGLGSLFFYAALARIDASIGQLLFGLYPVFVALLLYFDGLQHTKITILSTALSIPAIFFLTQVSALQIDMLGVGYMLIAGFLYAVHIPINQRVLYEAPAPTVTLYTLFAMMLVVVPAYFIFSPRIPSLPQPAWIPLLALTLVTFLSRLMLFTGVKSIGGMRTSLLGLMELLVTIVLAHLLLGESLTSQQWFGASLLSLALILAGGDQPAIMVKHTRGWLGWLSPRFESHTESERPASSGVPESLSTDPTARPQGLTTNPHLPDSGQDFPQ